MKTRRDRFKLNALSLAIISSCCMQTFAAENKKPEQEEKDPVETIETIEITGYRGSVLKSMNNKRYSSNVTDSIFAEDIGKSTDQNIADALSRVTGVSVQTENGEGTKISVRGANPDQNIITLNGVQLTSNDTSQSVDLSSYSADILSKIEVVKTPSADHDEGALGATINLSTLKPLEQSENIRTFTSQARYNDYSEEGDYKISGTLTETFLDDTLGLAVTAFKETQKTRRDSFFIGPGQIQAIDVARAKDLDGNLLTNTRAISYSNLQYDLNLDERNRHGGSVVLQFRPTDSTDISFDANYSKQERVNVSHGVFIRPRSDQPNFQEGIEHHVSPTYGKWVPPFSDPQEDWWVVDNNHTLVKQLGRFGDGGYNSNFGGSDVENSTLQLSLSQYITDSIKVDVGINTAKTTEVSVPSTFINMATWNSIPASALSKAGAYGTPVTGIQPVGYDCLGGKCEFQYGDSIAYEGNVADDGDNFAATGFNPRDRATTHIGYLGRNVTDIKDEQKTGFIDVDWELDLGPITKIEFGAKYSERDKDISIVSKRFESVLQGTSITIFDNDGVAIGTRTLRPNGAINDIRGSEVASSEPFPVDNFLANIGYGNNPNSDSITSGWPLVDPVLALEQALGSVNAEQLVDNSGTRGVSLKNSAAYLKFKFELADNLTGDIGVRYVKTDVDSYGYSSAEFMTDPLNSHRIFDPFYMLQVRNNKNPLCGGGIEPVALEGPYTDINGNTYTLPENPAPEAYIYHRFDGYGWNLNGTSKHLDGTDVYTDDVPLPASMQPGDVCYDPYTDTYNGDPSASSSWVNLARHADISTSKNFHFFDGVRSTLTDDNIASSSDNRSKPSFATTGDNTYDMYLPSLNVNWAISDEMIARFSASKTMSRPRIDSLNPGFKMFEDAWGSPRNHNVSLSNPKLMPQESNNLDFSFEWYFNQTSMVSMALFHKKMSNFEEQEDFRSYIDDLRLIDFSQGYDSTSLLRSEGQLVEAFNADRSTDGSFMGHCMPNRAQAPHTQEGWFQSGDIDTVGVTNEELLEKCASFVVNRLRNGKGATIKGIELGYTQTYDFLPGIWGGLGLQANYTYQESETDTEYNEITGDLLPVFPREWTPKHSYNTTVFWEQDGHQLRLSYRGKSDELIQRSWGAGALWREGNGTFDFSASYKVSDAIQVSLHALNLTDTLTRNYFTSRLLHLGDYELDANGEQVLNDNGEPTKIYFDEGNALDGDAYTGRTQSEYKTGRIYRLDLRVSF
ncbi:TonB-dependent receptor [Thalassotalea agariperforans]